MRKYGISNEDIKEIDEEMRKTFSQYDYNKVETIVKRCVRNHDTLMDIAGCISMEMPTESDFVVNGVINLAGEIILERVRQSTAFEI